MFFSNVTVFNISGLSQRKDICSLTTFKLPGLKKKEKKKGRQNVHTLHPIVAHTNTFSAVQKLINYCFSVELVCLKHTWEYPPVAYTLFPFVCAQCTVNYHITAVKQVLMQAALKKKSSEGVKLTIEAHLVSTFTHFPLLLRSVKVSTSFIEKVV